MDAVRNAFYTIMLMGILLMGFTFIDLTGNVNYQVTETLYGGELIYLHSKNMVLTNNSRINVPGTLPPLIMSVNGKTQPTLTFQVNVTGNMKIIPHLYDWSFDGVDDHIKIPRSNSLEPSTLTSIIWFYLRRSTYTYNVPLSKYSPSNGWWIIVYSNLRISFAVYSGGTAYIADTGVPVINFNERAYLTCISNGTNVMIFVNAIQKAIANGPTAISHATVDLHLMKSSWFSQYCDGVVDNIYIFNRGLSSNEVSDGYNHVYNASGLILYLDATFYDSSLGKYIDLSGNSNHGTPYNGVARVISNNRYVTRLLNAASDNKAHFLIPEKYIYRILDANNNVLAEGLADGISDVALEVNGTVTLQLTPSWNNMDLYYAYYGNPPTGEAEKIVLQHPNGTLYALFDASTYDGAVIYDVKNGLTATPQYISIIDAANPALRIVRTSFLDDKYLWLHYLPIGMEIKIVYGQAQYTYRYNGTAIAFQLPEKPVKAKINYYHADKKLYIVLEKSIITIPVPNMPIQVGSVISFINMFWGDAALIVPMLLPVSIYLKKRSLTLAAGSLALISAINMLLFPQSISIILLWATALLIGLILYMVVYG